MRKQIMRVEWPLRLAAVLATLGLAACGALATSTAAPPDAVYGAWRLKEVNRGGASLILDDSQPVFTLTLHHDGSASGQEACNRWSGQATINDTLSLNGLGSTRARCHFDHHAVAALAERYLNALHAKSVFTLVDGGLELTISTGEVWWFERY